MLESFLAAEKMPGVKNSSCKNIVCMRHYDTVHCNNILFSIEKKKVNDHIDFPVCCKLLTASAYYCMGIEASHKSLTDRSDVENIH